jgi:hypothetical protein
MVIVEQYYLPNTQESANEQKNRRPARARCAAVPFFLVLFRTVLGECEETRTQRDALLALHLMHQRPGIF